MVVSISEKTLEHWAGIDLHGRVPSARQWWPTRGEDAAVGLVPTAAHSQPGLPSSCWNSRQQIPSGQRHGVKIDLGQLSTYLSRRGPSGQRLPVYYVFPVPHWTGSARSTYVSPMPGSVTASGTAPAEWLDLAAGDPCWFGHWLYVMPAADVARALPRGWLWRLSRDHGRRFENLFCIPPEPDQFGNRLAWSDPQVFARQPLYYPVLWPEFWRRMVAGRTHYARPWRITAAGLLDPDTGLHTPTGDVYAAAEHGEWFFDRSDKRPDDRGEFLGADDQVTLDDLRRLGELPWLMPDTEEPESLSALIAFRRMKPSAAEPAASESGGCR